MADSSIEIPLAIIVLDYVLGIVMWTLIGRSAMNLFLPVTSEFFFMKAFVKLTDPVLKVFAPITPGFLLPPLVPLFVAWFFFIVRFYLLPYLVFGSALATLAFPLESDVTRLLVQIFGIEP